MTVGGNIRKYRERIGITQTELANRLGISSRTVSSWEVSRTEPKMGMLERVCMVLNCRKSDIIEDTEYDISYKSENPALLQAAADKELFDTYHRLDQDRKKQLKEYARYLLFQQEEEAKEKETASQSSKEA